MVAESFPYTHQKYMLIIVVLSLLLACNAFSGDGQGSDIDQANENNHNNAEQAAQNEASDDQNEDQNQGQNQDAGEADEDPGTVQGESGQWVSINHGGFGFWYDPAVIEDIQPFSVDLAQEGAYQPAHPPYVQYDLLLDAGVISVVEVEWYKIVSEMAAEVFPELEALLAAGSAEDLRCIPELPLQTFYRECGHQQFHASLEFVDFKNGTGVRFVSVYGIQDTAAIDNEHLVYVYQGITDDGLCYLNATFRITHEGLEDFAEVPPEVYADMSGEIMQEYFTTHQQLLDADPEGYSPLLERFDLIIQSVEVAACAGG